MKSSVREVFARRWAELIAGTSYVSMGRDEVVAGLVPLTDRLVEAVVAPQLDPSVGRWVGASLVAAHFTGSDTLSRTLTLIIAELPEQLGGPVPGVDVTSRVAQLSAELAAGYADALRERSLDEQGSIYRAGLRARKQAEQALASSEARFRDPRLRIRFPLRCADGEPVWANPDISVLTDGKQAAKYLVTMVDDITDLQLLEQRLHHRDRGVLGGRSADRRTEHVLPR